ncbi:DNA/RNA non-specific endonuclease [Vibrio sp. S4M6]|uniref:DNA/RNA non-specific endonuclease n=1 Tax=Vibrio sinus TaxID=2946865 RepID=UPI00202AAA13|nr:DNA/RNA non-specific endonuclease [Vibrio sinus]MCL9780719.1 DNA/RNA non-specific endonuclease [Vibrio sinus]
MKLRTFGLVTAIGLTFSAGAYAENCLDGCPTGDNNGQTITRPIYTLKNNAKTKFADWVAYHVTQSTISGPSRHRDWKTDPDLNSANTLSPSDYKDAHAVIHTDRGHQAPIASFSNSPDWEMTNYLSNITPQASDLNEGPWARLEGAVRDYVKQGHDVYVVTGPLYESYFATLPDSSKTATIPSGYFKVIAEKQADGVHASAFIMYQDAGRSDNYCASEVTVSQVETKSGLDFMPQLSSSASYEMKHSLGGLTKQLGC